MSHFAADRRNQLSSRSNAIVCRLNSTDSILHPTSYVADVLRNSVHEVLVLGVACQRYATPRTWLIGVTPIQCRISPSPRRGLATAQDGVSIAEVVAVGLEIGSSQSRLAACVERVASRAPTVEVVTRLHQAGEALREELNLATDRSFFASQFRLQFSDPDKAPLNFARRGTSHVMQLPHLAVGRAEISYGALTPPAHPNQDGPTSS